MIYTLLVKCRSLQGTMDENNVVKGTDSGILLIAWQKQIQNSGNPNILCIICTV